MPQAKMKRVPPIEDDPIKHTAGGEMPDVDAESHHAYQESDFEEFAEIGDAGSRVPRRLATVFFAVGFGVGLYFLLRRSSGKRVSRHPYKEEGDEVSDEALRAMEIDEVQPSRLMGA